ncbi:MAG: serine hydrolase domain-containing protein [Novosphingobium sp.]
MAQNLSADESGRIDAAVTRVLDQTGIPAAQVAVVRDGKIVLSKAWGKASGSQPATADMRFQVASISKQFLAALMLRLENEGKLSLDDKVGKYMPEVTGADRITLRQLLSHTSGLQDYWPQDYAFTAMEKPVTPAGIVDRWAKKPLDYEPGTRWQYSNTGYVVAGMIAEKAGGADLWQQFEQKLFKPIGIHPVPLDSTNAAGFPKGHHRFALGPVRPARPAARGWLWAAGELAMSAEELARWDIARIERKLLPREDWEQQERAVILSDGTTSNYGLGVFRTAAGGRTRIAHGGASVGFLSENQVWLDTRTAVVVLTNADFGGGEEKISNAVAQIVLPRNVQANTGEMPRLEDVRNTLAALARGEVDPARFTGNARYYFDSTVTGDYRSTLAQLGTPKSIEQLGSTRLRGGFVNRVFTITWPGRSLLLITYAEPGANGRWEQFMLTD